MMRPLSGVLIVLLFVCLPARGQGGLPLQDLDPDLSISLSRAPGVFGWTFGSAGWPNGLSAHGTDPGHVILRWDGLDMDDLITARCSRPFRWRCSAAGNGTPWDASLWSPTPSPRVLPRPGSATNLPGTDCRRSAPCMSRTGFSGRKEWTGEPTPPPPACRPCSDTAAPDRGVNTTAAGFGAPGRSRRGCPGTGRHGRCGSPTWLPVDRSVRMPASFRSPEPDTNPSTSGWARVSRTMAHGDG